MGTTNHHRTWGPRLVGENCCNSSHREDNEPDEKNVQANVGIYNYHTNASKVQNTLFSYSASSLSCCREYRYCTTERVDHARWPIPAYPGPWAPSPSAQRINRLCPSTFSIVVRNHHHAIYLGRWIGHGGPNAGPPHSTDLNPSDQ
ncbi:hypothetical protein TNCV_452641 [Trichonephila clavipes]|nr:hypothetical protein TNCV_452641 [Trichonephila clavipes]